MRATRSDDLGIELLGQRLDDAGAEAGFRLGKDAVRFPGPVVSNRKLPIRSGNIKRDVDLPIICNVVECVLYSRGGYAT
jgi:hypothetical protein